MFGKLLLAFAISFGVAAVFGVWLVPYLKKIKAGQMIKENGPTWHMSKSGTPTMGGFIFIAGTAAACLTTGLSCMLAGDYSHIIVLFFALAFGAIGFLDDFEKLKKKQNLGLSAKSKFLLQLVVSFAFIFLLRRFGYLSPELYIPFLDVTWQLPEPLYVAFAAFAIVATVNAVNLTDGVDGLAAGTSIPVFFLFTALAFAWGRSFLGLGIFSAGLTGALMGFLLYNFNPASVFMGDTGSLFLGGAVSAVAFALDIPLVILISGIIFVAEVLSDVIQVVYFKLTHGKRFFKMAPLHHHFELKGNPETKVVAIYMIVTAITCLIALLSV